MQHHSFQSSKPALQVSCYQLLQLHGVSCVNVLYGRMKCNQYNRATAKGEILGRPKQFPKTFQSP